jgi:autotransporter-associated beta strand protein
LTITNNIVVNSNFTFAGGDNTGWSGPMDLAGGTRQITVTANTTISGDINNGGLIKAGTGVLTLSGASTYSGATTVSVGTLSITNGGSIANSAVINVMTGATLDVSYCIPGYTIANNQILMGNGGVVTGSVIVASGGAVSGGDTNAIGNLALGNDLTLQSGAVVQWNYNKAANTSDVVNVAGTLDLPVNATVNAIGTGSLPPAGLLMFSAGTLAGETNSLRGWTIVSPEGPAQAVVFGTQVRMMPLARGTLIKVY